MASALGSSVLTASARSAAIRVAALALLMGGALIAQLPVETPQQQPAPPRELPWWQRPIRPGRPDDWFPPKYEPQGFDWIRHKNGEWLKGELIAVYDRRLQFDSEELNEREFDVSDISWIRSPRKMAVVLTEDRAVYGTLLIRDGTVLVAAEGGEQRLNRHEIISIVPVADRWYQLWKGRLSLGLNAKSGNTELGQFKAQAYLMRRSEHSRLLAQYLGNIGQADGVQNVNNHRASARWDVFLTRRWFLTPIGVDFLADRFQNIDYQWTPAAGSGYYLLDQKNVSLVVSLGVGARHTRYLSVQPGESIDETFAAGLFGIELDWDITKDLEWKFNYSAEVAVPETSATNMHLITSLSIDLFKNFDLDLSFQWDRIGNPQESESGVTPLNDDFSTSIGIGYSF